jgi:tRNA-splicing ligase RtcB (3'-phosphate/5'-hydroxy nucleic acid ligase)
MQPNDKTDPVRTHAAPGDPGSGMRIVGDASLVLVDSPEVPFAAREVAALDAIRGLKGVVRAIGLPELHIKPDLEAPSSAAVATSDSIVLNFSSPSPGCGMALAAAQLEGRDLAPKFLDLFFAQLAAQLPLYSTARRAPIKDIRPFLRKGAPAAVEYYDLDPQALQMVDGGGNALAWPGVKGDEQEALDLFPPEFLQVAAQDFGMVGRGNHFLELQVVDEIFDPFLAEAWGLKLGQALVMYHADSGRFGAFLGRLYSHRRKNTLRGRAIELTYKIPYHLSQVRTPTHVSQRIRNYFWPRQFTFLPARSAAARQALLALSVGINYAFANRMAVLHQINQALCDTWGAEAGPVNLISDQTHNTIRLEQIEGQQLWIHRHNANRALPPGHPELQAAGRTDQPVLLPGTDRTHSFLCAAGTGAANTLYSVDHGAGRAALRLGAAAREADGRSDRSTRRYGYGLHPPVSVHHLGSQGVEAVADVLSLAQLAHPVLRLRPVAGLKDRTG